MILLDRLNARLLDNKERLRRLESTIDDVVKAAAEVGTDAGSAHYLRLADELKGDAERTRKLIERFEQLRRKILAR